MARIITLAIALLLIVQTAPVHAQNNPKVISEKEHEIAQEYLYKAVVYRPLWNPLSYGFETKKDVFYFNKWTFDGENKWTEDCSNKGIYVVLHDGVSFIADQSYKFQSFEWSNGSYRCYDDTKMIIINLRMENGVVVWQNFFNN